MKQHTTSHNLDYYLKKISDKKLKLTKQRKDIIECLVKHEGWHTIENVISHLSINNLAKPNVASVYNTLHSFVKHGLVQAFLNTTNFKIYYNIRHQAHEHAYFYQKNEFQTIPLPLKLTKALNLFFNMNKIQANNYYLVATNYQEKESSNE